MEFQQLIGLFAGGGLVFFIILNNIDKIKILFSILLLPLKFLNIFYQKGLAYRYEGTINLHCSSVSPDFFDRNVRIKWLNSSNIDKKPYSLSDKEELTVFVSRKKNPNATIVDIIENVVVNSLYPKLQASINNSFTDSNRLYISSRLIESFKDNSLTDYFNTRIFRQNINEVIESYLTEIKSLDNKYLYFKVFLDAVKQVDHMSITGAYDPLISEEIIKFFKFLVNISVKESGEDVELTFNGKYFKYSIILVAKIETLSSGGLAPFVNRIEKCRNLLVNRIYITGYGKKNVLNIKRLCYRIKSISGLNIIYQNSINIPMPDGVSLPLYIAIVDNYYQTLNELKVEEVKEIQNLLETHIPEVSKGIVEIEKISREKGVATKILVRKLEDGSSPLGFCIGTNKSRLNDIKSCLGDEWVEFIEFENDPKLLITNTLYPLKNEDILKIMIKSNSKSSIIYVKDDKIGLAIGALGVNVRLAEELIGWKLSIRKASQLEST